MESIISLGENTNLFPYNILYIEDNKRRFSKNLAQKKPVLKDRL